MLAGLRKATHKLSMTGQIHSAIKILRQFTNHDALDLRIPPEVIYGAKGLAFITQTKVGLIFSVSGGLGIVVVRDKEGKWTGPSAFGCGGVGAGFQAGASMTRSLLVLNNEAAVKAFSGGGQVKLGASLSVAAGPMGREAGVEARAGKGKVAACFSYAVTQGLSLGVSLEGAILTPRSSENEKFYGRKVKTKDILSGVERPPEDNGRLNELYVELRRLENKTSMRKDGNMHPSQIAHLVVFQFEEAQALMQLGMEDKGHKRRPRRKEQLEHIKAGLNFEERLDIQHAMSVLRDLTSTTEQELDSPRGIRKGGQRRSSIMKMRSDSKAIKQLKILASNHGIKLDLVKSAARCLQSQMDKKVFRGGDVLNWVMRGSASLMHPSIKTESDRIQLMLAKTIIGKDDQEIKSNLSERESEKLRRLLELRVMVVLNLMLEEGYLEPKKAEDTLRIRAVGFDLAKTYRFGRLSANHPSRSRSRSRSRSPARPRFSAQNSRLLLKSP
mmetsp:Transcript_9127/g.17789  ORF Transcript_9127/g.17789 Transcript_9127/m.17789 type:complete len:499 (+) Transcript_9127:459-1955(+)